MIFQNILFDMDGTLVDSAGDIISCLRSAYQQILGGVQINIEKKHIGPPLAEMIKTITPNLTADQLQRIVDQFRLCYDHSQLTLTVPYPGVSELLELLKGQKKTLFIVTNKPKTPVLKILNNLEMTCFRDMMTPDILPDIHLSKTKMVSLLMEKWALKPEETVIVGDSPADVQSGKDNRLWTAALLNGYGDEKALRESTPDHLFKDMNELTKTLFLNKETGK